jgi:streptogramin lyase
MSSIDDAGFDGTRPDLDPPYLWYAGAGLYAFTQAQTRASSDDGGQFRFVPSFATMNFHDLAFDDRGNLWTIPISGNQIIRLPAASLDPQATAAPGPDLVISSPALLSPENLAFDADGNLWVVAYGGAGQSIATIIRFDDPRGLTGNVTLDATVTIAPASTPEAQLQFLQPSALAFDQAGSLWFAAAANVLRFDGPQSLQGAVTAAPAAVLSGGDAYASIAFDAAGALWITGANGGFFVERIGNPGALAGAVNPIPIARVSLPGGASLFAGGLAFDATGALWVALSLQILEILDPGEPTGDVGVNPAVVLGVMPPPDLGSKLVFQPKPTGLPIF